MVASSCWNLDSMYRNTSSLYQDERDICESLFRLFAQVRVQQLVDERRRPDHYRQGGAGRGLAYLSHCHWTVRAWRCGYTTAIQLDNALRIIDPQWFTDRLQSQTLLNVLCHLISSQGIAQVCIAIVRLSRMMCGPPRYAARPIHKVGFSATTVLMHTKTRGAVSRAHTSTKAQPPSHIHCFIPGSKLTFSTNLFHHRLLAPTWTAFSDYTGPDLLCSTVFHF